MAFYKLCNNGDARTPEYRFSVTSKNDPFLVALKTDIARHNKLVRANLRERREETDSKYPWTSLLRVRLMSRGHRATYAEERYGHRRGYDSFLPHELAEYFDVYAGPDSHAMWKFDDQIRNNLTPGQQAIIEREQRKIWEAEYKMLSVLGKAGIVKGGDRNGTYYRGQD